MKVSLLGRCGVDIGGAYAELENTWKARGPRYRRVPQLCPLIISPRAHDSTHLPSVLNIPPAHHKHTQHWCDSRHISNMWFCHTLQTNVVTFADVKLEMVNQPAYNKCCPTSSEIHLPAKAHLFSALAGAKDRAPKWKPANLPPTIWAKFTHDESYFRQHPWRIRINLAGTKLQEKLEQIPIKYSL